MRTYFSSERTRTSLILSIISLQILSVSILAGALVTSPEISTVAAVLTSSGQESGNVAAIPLKNSQNPVALTMGQSSVRNGIETAEDGLHPTHSPVQRKRSHPISSNDQIATGNRKGSEKGDVGERRSHENQKENLFQSVPSGSVRKPQSKGNWKNSKADPEGKIIQGKTTTSDPRLDSEMSGGKGANGESLKRRIRNMKTGSNSNSNKDVNGHGNANANSLPGIQTDSGTGLSGRRNRIRRSFLTTHSLLSTTTPTDTSSDLSKANAKAKSIPFHLHRELDGGGREAVVETKEERLGNVDANTNTNANAKLYRKGNVEEDETPRGFPETDLEPWEFHTNTNRNGKTYESEEDILRLLSLIGSKEGVNLFPGNHFLPQQQQQSHSSSHDFYPSQISHDNEDDSEEEPAILLSYHGSTDDNTNDDDNVDDNDDDNEFVTFTEPRRKATPVESKQQNRGEIVSGRSPLGQQPTEDEYQGEKGWTDTPINLYHYGRRRRSGIGSSGNEHISSHVTRNRNRFGLPRQRPAEQERGLEAGIGSDAHGKGVNEIGRLFAAYLNPRMDTYGRTSYKRNLHTSQNPIGLRFGQTLPEVANLNPLSIEVVFKSQQKHQREKDPYAFDIPDSNPLANVNGLDNEKDTDYFLGQLLRQSQHQYKTEPRLPVYHRWIL